jgi:hypothetical protein
MPTIDPKTIHPNSLTVRHESGRELDFAFVHRVEIRFTLGIAPYEFALATEDKSWLGLKGDGVTINVESSKIDGYSKRDTLSINGWRVSEVRRDHKNPAMYLVSFADPRFLPRYKALTKSYNLRWSNGDYDSMSLRQGGQLWSVGQALHDAMTRFGYNVKPISEWRASRAAIFETLPDNLGNVRSGGFFAASPDEVLGALLNVTDLTLVPTIDGMVNVVAKTGKGVPGEDSRLKSLVERGIVSGGASAPELRWVRPKKIRVHFERRHEGALFYDAPVDEGVTSSGSTVNVDGFRLENVMPLYDPDDLNNISELTYIGDALGEVGLTLAEARKRWFKKEIAVPSKNKNREYIDSPREILKKRWYSQRFKQFYHYWFRCVRDFSERAISNMRIGRLDRDTGAPMGASSAVFMDYAEDLRFASFEQGSNGNPLSGRFSENYPMDNALALNGAMIPAPFKATLINNGGDLLVGLSPNSSPSEEVKGVYPFMFKEPLNYGDVFKVLKDEEIEFLKPRAEIDGNFKMYVIYNGTYTGPTAKNDIPRSYHIDLPVFSDGEIDLIETRSEAMHAAFGMDNDRLVAAALAGEAAPPPTELLNGPKLREEARRLQAFFKRSFESRIAGATVCAGLDAFRNVPAGCDIAEVRLVIGGDAQWSVTTEHIIHPNARIEDTRDLDLEGKPRIIAETSNE